MASPAVSPYRSSPSSGYPDCPPPPIGSDGLPGPPASQRTSSWPPLQSSLPSHTHSAGTHSVPPQRNSSAPQAPRAKGSSLPARGSGPPQAVIRERANRLNSNFRISIPGGRRYRFYSDHRSKPFGRESDIPPTYRSPMLSECCENHHATPPNRCKYAGIY